ncbi:hypothetical protein K8R33_02785 [archaeon]|nr:hypothetical protein [archaeon]
MDIEEIEKNIEYVENQTHNIFNFKVNNEISTETIRKFKVLLKKRYYWEACEVIEPLINEFEKALIKSEPIANLRKAHFDTLKEWLKNVIRKHRKE